MILQTPEGAGAEKKITKFCLPVEPAGCVTLTEILTIYKCLIQVLLFSGEL